MSVQIVVHRGVKNILYDNSMVGILKAVFQNRFCEFDILWVDGKWRICHDFRAISAYHSCLTDLLLCLDQHRHLVKNKLIVDIKWDFVWNWRDAIADAIHQLRQDLVGWEDHPFWLQASHPKVLKSLLEQSLPDTWKLGMIVRSMSDMVDYHKSLHYAMVSLSDFSVEEIIYFSEQCAVVGYTCHNIKELSKYRHLFPYLEGIVCDVKV